MAKKAPEAAGKVAAAKPKTAAARPKSRKAKGAAGEASTSRITLSELEARYIGDTLRGLAYVAKKLALAIREKDSPTPFDVAEIEAVSQTCYGLAAALRLHGDDGSNGG